MIKIKHCIIVFLLFPACAWAQLKVYSTVSKQSHKTQKQPARTQEVTLVSLPFWDDFSFATEGHAVDTLWIDNKKVFVSGGQGKNAPSINVATFDGLDSIGIAYDPSPSDVLNRGYRDTLVSQPIRLGDVLANQFDSTFLSFYYQWAGNGEPPDQNDFLRLEFRTNNPTETWNTILTLRVSDDLDPTTFYDTLIKISDPVYFHNNFQFRFISFGRKSGMFDAWHIDYVYLNTSRFANDRSRPDRTVTSQLTTLFDNYYAIPKAHLDSSRIISAPQFDVYNLKTTEGQPTTYLIGGTFLNYHDNIATVFSSRLGPDTARNIGVIDALEKKTIDLQYLPDPNDPVQFDYSADSILVKIAIRLFARDVFKNPGIYTEDYDTAQYLPMDFRLNDTTSRTYMVKDFYAYDDGAAEYSAGLVNAGNELAYRFDTKVSADTVNGLLIHFPSFTGENASSVDFFILGHINGFPGALIYEQSVAITGTTNNKFQVVDFDYAVPVTGFFFVGYRQPVSGTVAIGLDKSNDTGDQMYYRGSAEGTWQLNNEINGSFMIRPRFGHSIPPTGVDPEVLRPVSFYPNPNTGTFTAKGIFDQLYITSITGQPISFQLEPIGEETRIYLQDAPRGLYIARYRSGTRIFTEKIVVQK